MTSQLRADCGMRSKSTESAPDWLRVSLASFPGLPANLRVVSGVIVAHPDRKKRERPGLKCHVR